MQVKSSEADIWTGSQERNDFIPKLFSGNTEAGTLRVAIDMRKPYANADFLVVTGH